MTPDVGKVYSTDVHLLSQEIKLLGEALAEERLKRKTDVDRLRLEIEALRDFLNEMNLDFRGKYEEFLACERLKWNPELQKKEG
jgi:hypothetical protein